MTHIEHSHCQCDACIGGVVHSSDCSVHNMPAYPNGPCDCGAIGSSSVISPEQLKEICTLTVELIRLRQKECAHLCIENVAPQLFGGLIREFSR